MAQTLSKASKPRRAAARHHYRLHEIKRKAGPHRRWALRSTRLTIGKCPGVWSSTGNLDSEALWTSPAKSDGTAWDARAYGRQTVSAACYRSGPGQANRVADKASEQALSQETIYT